MIARERDILPIGYGAMLLEGFVSVTALIAACGLEPGDYFKINIDPKDYAVVIARTEGTPGLDMAPKEFDALQASTGEANLAGKTGGAVTLAVGMAKIFSSLLGTTALMSYWYHFVIMFEALFILTLLETGTRVARFIFQEVVHQSLPAKLAQRWDVNLGLNVALSLSVCGLWGYLLYSGNIATLWRMMGIANQLLAMLALAIGTTYLLEYAPAAGLCLLHRYSPGFRCGHGIHRGRPEHSELASRAGKPAVGIAGRLLLEARLDSGGHHARAVRPGSSRFPSALGCAASQPGRAARGTGWKGRVTTDKVVELTGGSQRC